MIISGDRSEHLKTNRNQTGHFVTRKNIRGTNRNNCGHLRTLADQGTFFHTWRDVFPHKLVEKRPFLAKNGNRWDVFPQEGRFSTHMGRFSTCKNVPPLVEKRPSVRFGSQVHRTVFNWSALVHFGFHQTSFVSICFALNHFETLQVRVCTLWIVFVRICSSQIRKIPDCSACVRRIFVENSK